MKLKIYLDTMSVAQFIDGDRQSFNNLIESGSTFTTSISSILEIISFGKTSGSLDAIITNLAIAMSIRSIDKDILSLFNSLLIKMKKSKIEPNISSLVHLVTAIDEKCNVLITEDQFLTSLDSSIVDGIKISTPDDFFASRGKESPEKEQFALEF